MNIELIAVRDPDGPVDITVLVDGVEHTTSEYLIDAGAGWDWEDWKESRNRNLATASPAARTILESAYSDPPGGKYVDKPDNTGWLDGMPAF